ncbi:MAG: hypothetical protein ACXWF8_09190 [Methylobacter sp.]
MSLITPPAFADWFHKLVRYECDKATNVLAISYIGAYNEAGEAMLANAGKDEWDPWKLLEIQDDDTGSQVTKIKSEERTCSLSDGTYKVVIAGAPDNANILGRCGANVSASVVITNNEKSIYSGGLEGDCQGDAPIITEIKIVPGKLPQVTTVPKNEFY